MELQTQAAVTVYLVGNMKQKTLKQIEPDINEHLKAIWLAVLKHMEDKGLDGPVSALLTFVSSCASFGIHLIISLVLLDMYQEMSQHQTRNMLLSGSLTNTISNFACSMLLPNLENP